MLYYNFSPCILLSSSSSSSSHPASLIGFIWFTICLRVAHATSTFCTIAPLYRPPFPPSTFATSPPNLARPAQPGRALTWCTTMCWPTWTGPVWTHRAAVAACHGQNCPLTFRRTLTMTPSGPPTVTGWVQCRVRAASLTRTKERTVLPRCTVM